MTLINWDLNVEKNIVVINLYPDLDFELPDYLIHNTQLCVAYFLSTDQIKINRFYYCCLLCHKNIYSI